MNNNIYYKHRKEIAAFGKGSGDDVDVICLKWLKANGYNENEYRTHLKPFMDEWRKHLQVSGEEAARFFRGEIG